MSESPTAEPATSPAPVSAACEAVLAKFRPREFTEAERRAMALRVELDAARESARLAAEKHHYWSRVSRGRTGTTFAGYVASCPEQGKALAAAREFAESIADRLAGGTGALFYGPVGTGKDHLALCILRAAISAGHSVERIIGQEWFGKVRDAMDSDTTERSLVDSLVKPDWLLISDPLPPFGALTQHQACMLFRVVDERSECGRPTITTVNVPDGKTAAERMGESTWDRLKAGAWVFPCNWSSHRQPARIVQ